MRAYAINLERDHERRARLERELSSHAVDYEIVPAYDGHDPQFPFWQYRSVAKPFWGRQRDFKPGAFACFLSHARCWEMVASGDSAAMILEDDAHFDGVALDGFRQEVLPQDFDIVFPHLGLHSWLQLDGQVPARAFVGLSDLLTRLVVAATFRERIPGPGAYGYVLSKAGAAALLRLLATRGVSMGVDYAMAFNSLSDADLERLRRLPPECRPKPLTYYIQQESTHQERVALRTFVYTPRAVVHHAGDQSSIRHDVFLDRRAFQRLTPSE